MTVTNASTRNEYVADGTIARFFFTFSVDASTRNEYVADGTIARFFFTFSVVTSEDHVAVFLNGLKLGFGYVVAPYPGQPDLRIGGQVTFINAQGGASPPAAGTKVRIERTVPLNQETVWTQYSMKPQTIEKALDRLVCQTQQLERDKATHADVDAKIAAAALGQIDPGAALVTPLGAHTARTLAARFADTANVKDYGAKGDGSTDDTEAIRAAVAAGADVVFPPGTYKLTGSITLPGGRDIRIRGSGGGTVLARADAGMIFYRNTRGDLTEIDGLIFTGKAKAFQYEALDAPLPHIEQRHEFRIRNCRFLQDATDYAIHLQGAREGAIENCYFETNQGIYRRQAINTQIVGCHFKNTTHVVRDVISEGLAIIGGVALGCANGLWSTGPTFGIQIVGVMWDYLDAPVTMSAANDAVITGSYISTRTANPAVLVTSEVGTRSANVRIVGNPALITNGDDAGDGDVAVRVEDTDYFEIASNGIKNWKVNGVEYHNCTRGSIHDNTILPRPSFGVSAIAAGTDSATVAIERNVVGKPISVSAATVRTQGTGSPEAALAAPRGSVYLRTDGGAGTTLYVKESGIGNTGWVAK
jgi:Pectate lyase superfamily protein